MGKLLFSANGRIDGRTFQKGALVLLIINALLWQAWLLGIGLGVVAFFLSLVLIYCWGCLFAKRFHDAGKPGWLYLPILIAFIIISYFLGSIMLAKMAPEIVREAQGLRGTMDRQNPDIEYLLTFYGRMFKAMSMPYTISYLVTGAALAFGINAVLKTESGPNQHGGSDTTFD